MSPQNVTIFKELAVLHRQYRDCGLEILAFPCDQFGSHASAPLESREGTWVDKMGIEFPIMQKVNVNGVEEHPVYGLLKHGGHDIRGNFQTSFIVACGDERCRVSRFDGLPPRALRSRIENLLTELPSS